MNRTLSDYIIYTVAQGRLICNLAVLLVLFGIVYRAHSIRTISCIFPPETSPSLCMSIEQLCRGLISQTTGVLANAAELRTMLQQAVPHVQDCSIIHDRYGHATVSCSLAPPLLYLIDVGYIAENGLLVKTDCYIPAVREIVPTLYVQEAAYPQKNRNALCASWVTQVPASLLQEYAITWQSAAHIELRPRHSSIPLTFILWTHQQCSPDLMSALCAIQTMCETAAIKQQSQKSSRHAKQLQSIRVDMRVPHYAIVTEYKQEAL